MLQSQRENMAAQQKKFTAQIKLDDNGWHAKVVGVPSLVAEGHSNRACRIRLDAAIKEKYPDLDDFEVEYKVTLPSELQAALDDYLEKRRGLDELVEITYHTKIALTKKLLSRSVPQAMIADLIGEAPTTITSLLSRHSTTRQQKPSTTRQQKTSTKRYT